MANFFLMFARHIQKTAIQKFFKHKKVLKNDIAVENLLSIGNRKHNKMLDPLDQAWQNGSAPAA